MLRNRWRRFGVCLALGGLVLGLFGCGAEPTAPNVILITIDTLRADRLGQYGYPRGTTPHLDRWFRSARVVPRSYSTAASTPPSMVSILSGAPPSEHRVRLYYHLVPDDLETIPDWLPENYQTAAFISNLVLTDEAIGLASRFDHYDDFVDEKEPNRAVYERSAGRTTDAVVEWLHRIHDPDRPTFLWVHYIDPHGPYRPPADWPETYRHEGEHPVEPERIPRYVRLDGVTDGLDYVDGYDDEVRFADREVGRLLREISSPMSLDESLVIVTSDHGESLMEHEKWFRHGHHVYDEVVRVPLLARGAGLAPGVHAGPASGLDVVPTVREFLGAGPLDLSGVPLQRDAGAETRFVESEASTQSGLWKSAVRGGQKWMSRFTRGGDRAEARLYDLEADPRELLPGRGEWGSDAPTHWEQDPYVTGESLDARMGQRLDTPKVSDRADSTALDGLRSLGYVD